MNKNQNSKANNFKPNMTQNQNMKDIAKHHIQSFNYSMKKVLPLIHKYIKPLELTSPEKLKTIFGSLTIAYESFELGKPQVETKTADNSKIKETLYPNECREREMNYSIPLYANIRRKFDTSIEEVFVLKLGEIPVMVKSDYCSLHNKTFEQTIQNKEDICDFGGYFIINGNEKLIRMISIPRRNYPIGFIRPSYTKKTKNCSEYAVQIKCVREDLTSQTMTFHYLHDGNCMARLLIRKQEYLIPIGILIKAISNVNDSQLYNKLIGDSSNLKLKECVEVILAESKKYGIIHQYQYLEYIGKRFRDLLGFQNNEKLNNEEIGQVFINEYIMIHLNSNNDKLNLMCLSLQKLYKLAFKQIKPDNMDSPLNHEVLLSGHLYLMVLKEKLEETLQTVKARLMKIFNNYNKSNTNEIFNPVFIKNEFDKSSNLGKRMENFLATGNLISKTGLDLMQMGGYSILAEKLNNMRYISHFRSIHRGQFFTEMKTTTPRKLLPDSWGFLCPVHTPDGSPCGLLNHISSSCEIITHEMEEKDSHMKIIETCVNSGMVSISQNSGNMSMSSYDILLDGKVIGYIKNELVFNFLSLIRKYKVNSLFSIPSTIEIGYIPKTNDIFKEIDNSDDVHLQFPGIFLFTCIARMIRPVHNLIYNKTEYIGPLEQQYLEIACVPEDIKPETTHQEIDPMNMLSLVASLTPFCEYNQSPRNMYQCQMAKQTMGTPYYNYPHRIDNKTYRILFPQMPIIHTPNFIKYGFDTNPSGTNAVVAVLSYTGYDMEDAMIINKSAYERGIGYGLVYKSITKRLNENKSFGGISSVKYRMLNVKHNKNDLLIVSSSKIGKLPEYITDDGLPYIGTKLIDGMVELIYVDEVKNSIVVNYYKNQESCYVDQIRIYNTGLNNDEVNINFILRYKRFPVIGDKFSSRHGQKGVLSCLWPQINMPFTEEGITPDIIINPHAFPSRMTIGMLIESLAGKSGSMEGKFQVFSPFDQIEEDDLIGYFGKELSKNGYNYHGSEIMYSGVSGLRLKADIYIGVVYYQRLRHMVNDKAQARSTGPIDVLTRQPVKGRKNQGGIRFGEMERDGLLAHGVSYCLNERLFKSSDYSEGYICKTCGELLAVMHKQTGENLKIKESIILADLGLEKGVDNIRKQLPYCNKCKNGDGCVRICIPYVLRYLTNELAGMNIKLSFKVKENN